MSWNLNTNKIPIDILILQITPKDYAKLATVGARRGYSVIFEYYQSDISADKDLDGLKITKKLDPESKTFEEWVIANKEMLKNAFE